MTRNSACHAQQFFAAANGRSADYRQQNDALHKKGEGSVNAG